MTTIADYDRAVNADMDAVLLDQAEALTYPAYPDAPDESDRRRFAEETRDDDCNPADWGAYWDAYRWELGAEPVAGDVPPKATREERDALAHDQMADIARLAEGWNP